MLMLWRMLLGRASFADRWLSEQFISEAHTLRIAREWERNV